MELKPRELMQRMASFFESHQIAYRVVGSMASMAYGEPRLTIDIDIVAELTPQHVGLICDSFSPPEYYVSVGSAAQLRIGQATSHRRAAFVSSRDSTMSGRVRRTKCRWLERIA